MQVKLTASQRWISLGEHLAVGGEGVIYIVATDPGLVAKIYHDHVLKEEHILKIRFMLRISPYPSGKPLPAQLPLAWPTDLAENERGKPIGFVMPRVHNMKSIFHACNPRRRRANFPGFTWLHLHRIAYNLAAAVDLVHGTSGCVIGDINESNAMTCSDALVTLLDCDSFQVGPFSMPGPRGQKTFFRCRVGKPEYTPPELQGVRFADANRTEASDRFSLAVLIWQLLMVGSHPFDGMYIGFGDPPPLRAARIKDGHFIYGGGRGKGRIPYKPIPHALPFAALDPKIRELFVRCFRDGHKNPSVRPSAKEWGLALQDAEGGLVQCKMNPKHYFSSAVGICSWCLQREVFKIESFP